MEDIKHVQLSEIAELITKGTTPTTLGYEFQDDGVNFLKVECFDEIGGFIESKVAHISEECHEKLKRSQLKAGDILFSIAGAIGRVAIVAEEMLPANTNQALAIIRISDDEVYLPYIKLILTSPIVKEQFEKKKQGVAQLNLSLNDINEISVPLPSKDKQIELAKMFGKVADVIAKRNKELTVLDDLVKARFVEMFGDPVLNPFSWEMKRFDEICENLDSRRKPISSGDRVEGIYPYYGASGIVDYVEDYIFDEDILLVSEDGANLLMRSTPIAFSVSGKVWVNNHAHVVRFDKMSLQKYVEIYFSLIDLSDSITGSAQPKLNQAKLNAMMIPIPEDKLLDRYCEFLYQVDKSKVAVQKSLDKLQILFDKLMQEYFK